MKKILALPIILFSLIALIGTLPSSVSSLTDYCIPANIVNSQTAATPTGFQVMLTFNSLNYTTYLASSLQNMYFYNTSNGAQLPMWIEGNASNEMNSNSLNAAANVIIWVNLGANTISASSPASQYAFGIGATATNFFVSGNNVGEAPQLSPSYGEYDNGASVFNNYWNFAGTSLPTGWTNTGITYSVNNGISATATTASGYISYGTSISAPTIVEGYGNLYQSNGDWTGIGLMTVPVVNQAGYQGMSISTGFATSGYQAEGTYQGIQTEDSTETNTGGGTATNANQIWSVAYISTSSSAYFSNYINIGSTLTSPTVSTPLYPAMFEAGASASSYTFSQTAFIQWLRTRAYPPNGVMPTTTFGAVKSLAVSLSISPNPATYGQQITITATCASSDSCAVDYPALGTAIATGTGSATYTYQPFALGAGTYSSYYGKDNSAGSNTIPYTLTVGKNTSILTFTKECPSYLPLGQNCTTTATYVTHNSQLEGTLTLNGKTVGTSSGGTVSYLFTANFIGSEKFVFSTPGNSNYTANTISYEFNISTPLDAQNVSLTTSITSPGRTLNSSFSHYPVRFFVDNTNPSLSFNLTLAPGTVFNPQSLNNTLQNVRFSATTSLTGGIIAHNVSCSSGVIIYSHEHPIIATQTLNLSGCTVNTGKTANGGASGTGATSVPGGTTSGTSPVFSNSNVITWNSNWTAYLTGAGGGGATNGTSYPKSFGGKGGASEYGGCSSGCSQQPGGNGANGTFFQGNIIKMGTVIANGTAGSSLVSAEGSGGGGGGALIFVYGTSYTAGTYNVSGGLGGGTQGFAGSPGTVSAFKYSTAPLILYPVGFNGFRLITQAENFSYFPKPNWGSGNYSFLASEAEGTNSVNITAVVPLDEEVLSCNPGFNQTNENFTYFPVAVNALRESCWNPAPGNYIYDGLVNGTVIGKGTSDNSLEVNIRANYPSFSPTYAFNLTLRNMQPYYRNLSTYNPCGGELSEISGNVPSGRCTRRTYNISLDDAVSKDSMIGNTTVSVISTFNNYSIATKGSVYNSSSASVFLPNSSFQNPSIFYSEVDELTTSGDYFPSKNGYCSGFVGSTQVNKETIYMVSYSRGQSTTITLLSNLNGAQNGWFLRVLSGLNSQSATIAQQYVIGTSSITLPLIAEGSYAFQWLNPACNVVNTTGFQTWPTSFNLQLPTNSSVPIITLPNTTASCSIVNGTRNNRTVSCSGDDKSGKVTQWNVAIYNASGFASLMEIHNATLNGSSFLYSYTSPLIPEHNVKVIITYFYGTNYDPAGSYGLVLNKYLHPGFNGALDGLITLVFLLLGIGVGVGISEGSVHALSNTVFIEALIVVFLYVVGITQAVGLFYNSIAVVFLIIVGIIGYKDEGNGGGL